MNEHGLPAKTNYEKSLDILSQSDIAVVNREELVHKCS